MFAGVGERTREGNDFYHEMSDAGVVNQANLGESKVAMVYGQMNEPPGNRLRVALTGLTMAEAFRDEGRDVLFFVDNIYRYTLAGTEDVRSAGPYAFRCGLPAYAGRRNGQSARAYYLDQGGFDHFDPGRVRACRRLDRPFACHDLCPLGLHRGAVA